MINTLLLASFLLLSGAFVSANNLPVVAGETPFNDFSGGLNINEPSHLLNPNQSPSLRNVLIDEKDGTLVGRKGFAIAGSCSTMGNIVSMYPYNNENGDKRLIVSDSSRVLATSDLNTWTLLRSGQSTSGRLRGDQVWNKFWGTNGVDSVWTWDLSTVTVLDGQTYGSFKTPNVPRGKYIRLWRERPWIYNTAGQPTGLYFTNVASTDSVPIAIAPDSENAWPGENVLYIGRGDGEDGSGLFVKGDNLHAGKKSSLYAIFGDKTSNFDEQQVVSGVGMIDQQDATILDDSVKFVGNGGVYSFASNITRISEPIRPLVDLVTGNTAKIITNSWDTKSSFGRGTFYNTTATVLDVLTIETTGYLSGGAGTLQSFTVTSTSTFYVPLTTSNSLLPSRYDGRLSTITYNVVNGGGNLCASGRILNADFSFLNNRTGLRSSFLTSWTNQQTYGYTVTTGIPNGINITEKDISNNLIDWKVSVDTRACEPDGVTLGISSIGTLNQGAILLSTNTGQFVSEITTVTTISFWDTLLVDQNTNGGQISFFYKTSTSAVNIATQNWVAITPGSVIGSSASNNYIQWAATMIAGNHSLPPEILALDIRHNEGRSSSVIPFSIGWENRFWLFFSTDSAGAVNNGFILSKTTSKNPNAWTFFDSIPIYSLVRFNGSLYAGGANGKIYRLDFGTNDNGNPINYEYNTPDSVGQYAWRDKKVREVILDAERESGKTISLSVRTNFGDYVEQNIAFNGSGRKIYNSKLFQGNGNTIGIRVRQSQLDKGFSVYGLGVIYDVQENRSSQP